jgi:hypothetical protein
MDVCIKNVDPEIWKEFKIGAVKKGVSMAEYLKGLIEEEKKDIDWKMILREKPAFYKNEAAEIRKASKSFRKGFDMR